MWNVTTAASELEKQELTKEIVHLAACLYLATPFWKSEMRVYMHFKKQHES